jgi:hypothetical protein
VAATCLSCSDEFTTDAPQPVCPQCGSLLVQLDPDAPMVVLTDVGIDDEEGPGEAGEGDQAGEPEGGAGGSEA